MSEHEPLPEELAELFAAERAAPVGDAAARAAAKSRLVAAIRHLPLGGSGAAAGAVAGAGKVIAVLALTIGVGAGTVALVKHETRATAPTKQAVTREPSPPANPMAAPPTAETPPASPSSVDQAPDSMTSTDVPSANAARPSTRGAKQRSGPSHDEAQSQARLLRGAWSALNADHGAEALELVREDARLHRGGALAEEREALTVLALAQLGRLAEARAASSTFIARYPASVHRARVERAVALGIEESP